MTRPHVEPYGEMLEAVEKRALELFFGHEILDPDLKLAAAEAVRHSPLPLRDLCTRVLFEGPNARLSTDERRIGRRRIIIRADASDESRVQCIDVDLENFRGLPGVRRLARSVFERLDCPGTARATAGEPRRDRALQPGPSRF